MSITTSNRKYFGNFEDVEKIFNSKIKKDDIDKIEPFKASPKLRKLIKSFTSYEITYKTLGHLSIQVDIKDKIVPGQSCITTLGSEKEFISILPKLIFTLGHDMSDAERKFYFLKEGELPELDEEHVSRHVYDKTRKVSKIIKNPYREGTHSAQAFNDLREVAIGKSHKEIIKLGLNGGALKKGWEKGYVIFEV